MSKTPMLARDLVLEHGVLIRRLAQLQQRVDELLQAAAHKQSVLEADNICLRAELVRVRTAVAWNLRPAALAPATTTRRSTVPVLDPELREAQEVICQTGCSGHAHPWLDADGHCRRTGQACDRLEECDTVQPLVAPQRVTPTA